MIIKKKRELDEIPDVSSEEDKDYSSIAKERIDNLLSKTKLEPETVLDRKQKIKDALVNIPDDILLNIILDYNKDNHYQPIYNNDPDILAKLKHEGFEQNEDYQENDKYISANQYSGIESFNNLNEKVDTEELVPYIDENYEKKYSKILPLDEYSSTNLEASTDDIDEGEDYYPEDTEDIDDTENVDDTEVEDIRIEDRRKYDLEWFKSHWTSTPIGLNREKRRKENLAQIIKVLTDNNDAPDLLKKVKERISKWVKDPKEDYNNLKKDLANIFLNYDRENNAIEEGSDEETRKKNTLKSKVLKAFNTKYPSRKVEQYNELPETWKEKFGPYIEDLKEAAIENAINKLQGKKGEETIFDREEKFKELIKKYLNFDYNSAEDLKKYALKNEINEGQFLYAIETTLKLYKEENLPTEQIEKYFRDISYNIFNAIKNVKWLETPEDKAKELIASERAEKISVANPELKETETWKKYSPILVESYTPGTEDYEDFLNAILKNAKKELMEKKGVVEIEEDHFLEYLLKDNTDSKSLYNRNKEEVEEQLEEVWEHWPEIKRAYYVESENKINGLKPEQKKILQTLKTFLKLPCSNDALYNKYFDLLKLFAKNPVANASKLKR